MAAKKPAEPWLDAWMNSGRDPYRFATEVLPFLPFGSEMKDNRPVLERWQEDYLKGFFLDGAGRPVKDPRHSVRSGHGTGKTAVIAILALWFVSTHYDSKCVITAASQDQLRDGAWAELRKWWGRLPQALKEQIDVSEERAVIKAAPEMGFIVRRTASKSNPEALQGIHAKHVLYLIDEASGIADIIFEVAAGSLSTDGAIACLFSNPTRSSGYFFDTHHKLRDRWRAWVVSSESVPRARGHIEDIAAAYRKESNQYRVRVLGEFPTGDDETVIPLEWVNAAKGRDVAAQPLHPIWGVDVARFGDDRTAICKRQGNKLLEPPKWWQHCELDVTAGRIKAEWDGTPIDLRPSEILIDVIGYGAGVLAILRGQGLPVRGVNVAEAASIAGDCHRLRDELWFKGREWFRARDCSIPNSPEIEALVSDLVGLTYDFTPAGAKIVESKKAAKARGLRSPDLADAFLNTFAGSEKARQKQSKFQPTRSAWAA